MQGVRLCGVLGVDAQSHGLQLPQHTLHGTHTQSAYHDHIPHHPDIAWRTDFILEHRQ